MHSTTTGHIPAAQIASWACSCGASETIDYDRGVTGAFAVRVAAARAARHRTLERLRAALRSNGVPR